MSELERHHIRRISRVGVASRYGRLIGKNARLGSHGEGSTEPVVVIETTTGAIGWGHLHGPAGDVDRFIGRSVAELFDPAQGVILDDALALDFALHDLAGVLLTQPVYRLLGAQGPTAVSCYDGAIYMDDLDPEDAPRGVEQVLRHCADDYALGYRAFKLKIGRGHRWVAAEAGLRRDIEVTRAVREHYPHADILVDANDGYTVHTFLRYLEDVVDCRLFWIEEPFPETSAGLEQLRSYLDDHSPQTLIADGEAHPDVPLLLELAGAGLIDVLLMDIVGLGLTAWRKLMPRLRELDVLASPHNWGHPLKTLYTGHVAAGLGNVVTVEGVPGTASVAGTSAYRLEDGLLHVPDLPGWGIAPPSVR